MAGVRRIDATQGAMLPQMMRYGIPLLLSSLTQELFKIVDVAVLGNMADSTAVAAVGATGSITNLMVNFFIGLSVGAGVTVAHAIGSREEEAIHNTVHTAMPMALLSGIVLTFIGVVFSEQFLHMMVQ